MSRVVVVTGSASGIGRGMAERFAEDGARIAIADINAEGAEEVARELSATCEAAAFPVDVSKEASVAACVEAILSRWGRLDVLCANAGIYPAMPLAEMTESEWDRVTGINLKGVFFGCKHAVRTMRPTGGGAIVNVASILALVGDGILAAYCAAKGGVLGITRATAVQYGSDGIRCNAICPGDIDTPLVQAYFNTAADPASARKLGGRG